jgi:hypothetical protein
VISGTAIKATIRELMAEMLNVCGHDPNLCAVFGVIFTIGASDIDRTVVKQTWIPGEKIYERHQVAQES